MMEQEVKQKSDELAKQLWAKSLRTGQRARTSTARKEELTTSRLSSSWAE